MAPNYANSFMDYLESRIIKGTSADIWKTVFRKVMLMWPSMPISSFIGYTLTELFRKPDDWRQIYKTNEFDFLYIKRCVEKKKYFYVIARLRNILFLKNTEAATGSAEAVTGGVL